MATIKTILVPLDLASGSFAAPLDYARSLADALGASLHLLHVVCCPMDDAATRAAHSAESHGRIDQLLEPADRGRRHATTACVAGVPAPEIARYALEHDVDLIVMGTHPHGPSFQMIRGSIAEQVIGMVPCAVLTVKTPGDVPNGLLGNLVGATSGT